MGYDPYRTKQKYQTPQTPTQYGTPNTSTEYATTGVGSNTSGPGTITTVQPQKPINTSMQTGTSKGAQFGAAAGTQFGSQTPYNPPTPAAPAYGTQSGPGILENWFNMRASGSDPAFEYGLKRGAESLNNRYAAAGAYNSGAAAQGTSDLYANLISQRMGQLDALAGGASGEHQGRLNAMFGQGNALASGESGINSAYDINAANAQKDALAAALGYQINKAGVDDKSRAAGVGNIIGLGSLFA